MTSVLLSHEIVPSIHMDWSTWKCQNRVEEVNYECRSEDFEENLVHVDKLLLQDDYVVCRRISEVGIKVIGHKKETLSHNDYFDFHHRPKTELILQNLKNKSEALRDLNSPIIKKLKMPLNYNSGPIALRNNSRDGKLVES